jgi:hypothetical protein
MRDCNSSRETTSPGFLEQNLKDLEWLVLELDAASCLADLADTQVGFEFPKADGVKPVPRR